jgi:acyl dehydratase
MIHLHRSLRILSVQRVRIAATSLRRTLFDSKVTGNLLDRFGEVGAMAEIQHTFNNEDVLQFAAISGDNNPIHTDPEFASATMFKGCIVHGIFVSSLFSTLFGRSIPGSIYVSQDLRFKKPVLVGVPVTASIEVLRVDDKGSKGLLISCATRCRLASGDLAVDGEGKILVPSVIANELQKLKM